MPTPSIVIVSIDALRADCTPGADESPHLRSVGLQAPLLPAFSLLVQDATVFTQAIACSSYTTACHASLFTGLTPAEHGVRAFSVTALSNEVRTLAEIVGDAGYATCAMSDTLLFFQPYGLLRGFQATVSSLQDAMSWWDAYSARPRLLFVHLWDIHQPYGMPVGSEYQESYPEVVARWQDRLRSRGLTVTHTGSSAFENPERHYVSQMQVAWHQEMGFSAALQDYVDGLKTFDGGRLATLAQLLKTRSVLDQGIFVVTADHGEGRDVKPSRLLRHGTSLTDDQIRIPLYGRVPNNRPGYRIANQVSQADIAPTVLDLLGLLGERTRPLAACSGRSLVPLLKEQPFVDAPVYAEMSTVYRDPLESGDEPSVRRDPLLRYRIVRYPDRKYWLTGRPDTWSNEELCYPTPEFVALLFRRECGRHPTAGESEPWVGLAAKSCKSADRGSIVQRFRQSGELRQLPQRTIYDLQRDPLEERPLNAEKHVDDRAYFDTQAALMEAIDAAARAGEPLITQESDEQVIIKRLQGLGYIE